MKVLAALLVALSLPSIHFAPTPARTPVARGPAPRKTHSGGKWYMAGNGHAVYCTGPVMIMSQPDGELQRVATFCEGEKAIVPLKD